MTPNQPIAYAIETAASIGHLPDTRRVYLNRDAAHMAATDLLDTDHAGAEALEMIETADAGHIAGRALDAGDQLHVIPIDTLDADLLRELIEQDAGDAPCCAFGTRCEDWAPYAAAFVLCMMDGTGDPLTAELLDAAVGGIVNDSYGDLAVPLFGPEAHPFGGPLKRTLDWADVAERIAAR